MLIPFVLDRSVALAWMYPDEATEPTVCLRDSLIDDRAFVPSLWPVEPGSVLLAATKRGRLRTRWRPLNPPRFAGILPLDRLVAVSRFPGSDVPAHRGRVARRSKPFLHDASSTARSRQPDRTPALPPSRSS